MKLLHSFTCHTRAHTHNIICTYVCICIYIYLHKKIHIIKLSIRKTHVCRHIDVEVMVFRTTTTPRGRRACSFVKLSFGTSYRVWAALPLHGHSCIVLDSRWFQMSLILYSSLYSFILFTLVAPFVSLVYSRLRCSQGVSWTALGQQCSDWCQVTVALIMCHVEGFPKMHLNKKIHMSITLSNFGSFWIRILRFCLKVNQFSKMRRRRKRRESWKSGRHAGMNGTFVKATVYQGSKR